MTPRAAVACLFAVPLALPLGGCGSDARESSASAQDARERAVEAGTTRRRTGAEIQDRIVNRVVRTVYLCNNSERLTVDFDNARQMATIRQSSGRAVDLRRQQSEEGIWYTAGGYELRGQGSTATWSADGREPTSCRAVD